MESSFRGIYTALVTPFYKGEVDFVSLKKLLWFQLDQGIQGIVAGGTTAESPCLEDDEICSVVDCIRAEVDGQVPVVMGTGGASTQKTIKKTKQAERINVSAAMVVTPYYNKPTQEGLIAHYRAVSQSTSLPILLYNVPSRTGTALTLATLKTLSQEPNIVSIKEASGDLVFAKELFSSKIFSSCLSGDDFSCIDFINLGGDGVISVASHILPKELIQVFCEIENNKKSKVNKINSQGSHPSKESQAESKAEEFKTRYNPLLQALYHETNPMGVKVALKQMGLIRSHELRLPLIEGKETEIKKEMLKLGLC